MAITSGISSKGGKKLEAVLKKAEQRGVSKVKVGFLGGRYPDGTPDAVVAAANEYGLGGLPERPYFRQAIAELEQELPKQLRGIINPETMEISAGDAARIGAYAAGVLRDRIDALKDPENAASTIELKGSDNPLVDTGHLGDAVSWEAE